METLESILKKRQSDIENWSEKFMSKCKIEQKHLDSGTTEQEYWNYGYETALKDVLALLGKSETKN